MKFRACLVAASLALAGTATTATSGEGGGGEEESPFGADLESVRINLPPETPERFRYFSDAPGAEVVNPALEDFWRLHNQNPDPTPWMIRRYATPPGGSERSLAFGLPSGDKLQEIIDLTQEIIDQLPDDAFNDVPAPTPQDYPVPTGDEPVLSASFQYVSLGDHGFRKITVEVGATLDVLITGGLADLEDLQDDGGQPDGMILFTDGCPESVGPGVKIIVPSDTPGVCPGIITIEDLLITEPIFEDGFESGDTSAWGTFADAP